MSPAWLASRWRLMPSRSIDALRRMCRPSRYYNAGSAKSTLAASLIKHGERIGVAGLNETNVPGWIREHTDRVNFILDASLGVHVLNLLEAFLQCRLQPEFEGFASQRMIDREGEQK